MRVFEAPEQTRSAVLSKYRMVLAGNDPGEIEEFDNLVSGDVSISDADIEDDLLSSVDALLAITTSITLPMNDRRARGLDSIQEGQIEWLCKQFVPLESFGDYDSEDTSDLIWPEDLPRAIETLDWFMQARKDSKVQNQFRLMFPEEISDGASVKNPLDWSCYQMEDVQDALTPGKIATARNERWYPQERGFPPDEADVAYDQDGIMIVRTLKPSAASAYASGTRWCTSHRSTADDYLNTGPLYIVFDNGKKYAQAHYGFKRLHSESDDYASFMDIRDREIYDARNDIREAVANTILRDVSEYFEFMTVDSYIEKEYAAAVAKRDLEISRAKNAIATIERSQVLGSGMLSGRVADNGFLTKQSKRIPDAEDALADAMIKIGIKAEKAVFRNNLNIPMKRVHAQAAISQDEGLGGTTIDISMSESEMLMCLEMIMSNYSMWRNDTTMERENHIEIILNIAVQNEIVDNRITQLLIRIADWCRDSNWDRTEMSDSIKKYYKSLPSPIPPELAIALYKDMEDPDDGKWILRRANAATKRRLGRVVDDSENNATSIREYADWVALDSAEDEILGGLRELIEGSEDVALVCAELRSLSKHMGVAAKAFNRLKKLIHAPSFQDTLYGQAYTIPWSYNGNLSSKETRAANEDWIRRALTNRKNLPINTIDTMQVVAMGPDDDGDYMAELRATIREWDGSLYPVFGTNDYPVGDWHNNPQDAIAEGEEDQEEGIYAALANSIDADQGDSVVSDWGQTVVDIDRLEEIAKDRDGEMMNDITNYWVQLFLINCFFQARFGQQAWETFVAGGTPGIDNRLLERILKIQINDSMTIEQYSESITPIVKKDIMSSDLQPGLLLTDDSTIAGQTFREFRSRQLGPTPKIKGTYLNYDLNLASPDDHMDLTREVLAIYESGGQTIDHPAMSIFKGYFVEPLLPMSQRVVRQETTAGLPKPPAILGYVCYNTRRWIEWDSEDGWTEVWRPGTKHRKPAEPDHVLAVMPNSTRHGGWYGNARYNTTFVPIQAGVIWCTACGGARSPMRGQNSFAIDFARGSSPSWTESASRCYCGGSEKYETLYDELAE